METAKLSRNTDGVVRFDIQRHFLKMGNLLHTAPNDTASQSTVLTNADGWEPRLVVAIDIGTYASGYAMQWRSNYTGDPLKIDVNTHWSQGGLCTLKTPTCLLLKPDKTVAEFGYAAETTYCDLKENGENPDNWYFFRNFKMVLYRPNGDIDVNTQVDGAGGRHLPAKLVFSKFIRCMLDHVRHQLATSNLPYLEEETKWVISVPAIFGDRAKTIMRAVAEEAGIKRDKLSLAIEPECAAIYCSRLPRDQLEVKRPRGGMDYVAGPGSIIAVVDMGGGSVDITIVTVNADNTMRQVKSSGGGPWGGMRVDDKFQEFLRDVLGQNVSKEFVTDYQTEECELRKDFEYLKRQVKHPSEPGANKPCKITLPAALTDFWIKDNNGMSITDILKKRDDLADKNVRFVGGKLVFDSSVIGAFFDSAVNDIVGYIQRTLPPKNANNSYEINGVMLVGGFAMSSYVVHSIRDKLAAIGVPIVQCPPMPELAVLNGAVLFGHGDTIMESRVMTHTYGVGFTMKFDSSKHTDSEKFEVDGKYRANNVFRKHVTRGEAVKLGAWTREKMYYPDQTGQTQTTVYVYASTKTDPVHTNGPDCLCIGQFDVVFPNTGERAIRISMNFGSAEVKLKGVVKGTNATHLQFLTFR